MFNPLTFKKSAAYKKLANSEEGLVILKDLAGFCYSQKDSFDVDTHKMAYKEGRRSVFNRIRAFVDINEDKLKEIINE